MPVALSTISPIGASGDAVPIANAFHPPLSHFTHFTLSHSHTSHSHTPHSHSPFTLPLHTPLSSKASYIVTFTILSSDK